MSIDELIAEGEAIKASIDLRHKMGKLDEYRVWHQKVTRFLNQEVPGDIVIHKFDVAVKGFNSNYCSKESFEKVLSVLKAFQALPKLTEDTYTANKEPVGKIILNNNITQNQEQTQKQSQEVNILVDLLKNSLAPYQLEELKELAKSDVPTSEKRQNLMDKILSFGSNVGASVLANILTNPAVYSCL